MNKVSQIRETVLPRDTAELRAELTGCLQSMVEWLSTDHRDAITLVELEGLTQQAAATQIGLSLSGIKSRVQRGRVGLKQMLDDCCLTQLDRWGRVVDYHTRAASCDSCTDHHTHSDPDGAA